MRKIESSGLRKLASKKKIKKKNKYKVHLFNVNNVSEIVCLVAIFLPENQRKESKPKKKPAEFNQLADAPQCMYFLSVVISIKEITHAATKDP